MLALLALAAAASPAAWSASALSRAQVEQIWRSGRGIYCLHDGDNIQDFQNCSAMEVILSLSAERPNLDLRQFSLPTDAYDRVAGDHCPYTDAHDRLACAGIVLLFTTGAGFGHPTSAQKAFSQQVLEWVAPIEPGVRFRIDGLLHDLSSRDGAPNPNPGGDRK